MNKMFLYAKTENTKNKVQIILNVGKKYGANKYVGTKCSETSEKNAARKISVNSSWAESTMQIMFNIGRKHSSSNF